MSIRKELVRLDRHGVEVGRWSMLDDANDLAVSPDGAWIAVGQAAGDVTLWKPGATTPTARLLGHTARIGALAFTPDGRWLVTGGWDDSVRLWSLGVMELPAEALRATLEAEWGRNLDEVLAEQR